ncbi:MAG: HTTM domain-containing protein [Bdellovibrionota bacterium]
MISLHGRNPLVIQGGDVLFRVLLFWALFLPLGAYGSIDALRIHREKNPKTIFSIGTIAVLAQFVILYLFNYLYKLHPPWETEGIAIYQALSLDQFAKPVGIWLRQYPEFLSIITKPTLLFEGFGPILFLIPIFFGPIRTLACFLFLAMHFSFWLCLELGPFPYVNAVFILFFLPSWFWERASGLIELPCKFLKSLLRRIDRSLSGVKTLPEIEASSPVWKNVLLNLIAAIFLFNAVYFTVGTYKDKVNLPLWVDYISSFVRIDQRWNMFSPPATDDGWFVMPAKLRNGKRFDLHKAFWSNQEFPPVSWEKPAQVSKTYVTQRWRKYLMNLWHPDGRKFLLHYGRYLCRDWNEVHQGADALETIKIYFMLEPTDLNTQTPAVEKVLLWTHWCFEVPKDLKEPAE